MLEPGLSQRRISVPYFEGVNSMVDFNIGKKTEFNHLENGRSKIVGTIEKREGQTVLGKNEAFQTFITTKNYGLFSFIQDDSNNQGLYRISAFLDTSLNISVSDDISSTDVVDGNTGGPNNVPVPTTDPTCSKLPLTVTIVNKIQTTENLTGVNQANTTQYTANIYYLDSVNKWMPLSGNGKEITPGIFDNTFAEGCAFLVNQNSDNRYIDETGTNVITSSSTGGHLYNSPRAARINFYKNRLYLADFVKSGVRYKTTILRSSYPSGVLALFNADMDIIMNSPGGPNSTSESTALDVPITDTKYMYSDTGVNRYEIYRGPKKMATMTVSSVNEVSVTASFTSSVATPTNPITGKLILTLLASDEVWIEGTYTGKKIFRWVSNPTITGRDVKQYDTFKLSGGQNDEITMMMNIGNVMLISNKNSMTSWNDYILENLDLEIGCVSKRGYVKYYGTLYFLHYTGVYSTTGSKPQLISNKVEKYISGATKSGKENSAAGRKGNSVFFTLGDVTLYHPDGSIHTIVPDVCMEYNIIQENWFVHTNVKANQFTTFIENTNSDRLEFTDTAGNFAVKEFLSGETDDGQNIPFRADLMTLTTQGDNFEYSSKPIAIIAEVERGSAMQVYVDLNNGEDFYPLEGSLTKGLSIVRVTQKDVSRGQPPVCRLINISFRDSSKQLCKISRTTLVYLPTTDEDTTNEG